MVIGAGLGWAFGDLLANNSVGICSTVMTYNFSVDFLYAGVGSNLDTILFICTALLVAKLIRSERVARKLQQRSSDARGFEAQLKSTLQTLSKDPVCLFTLFLILLRYLEPLYLELGCNSIELTHDKHAVCTRLLRATIDSSEASSLRDFLKVDAVIKMLGVKASFTGFVFVFSTMLV